MRWQILPNPDIGTEPRGRDFEDFPKLFLGPDRWLGRRRHNAIDGQKWAIFAGFARLAGARQATRRSLELCKKVASLWRYA